MEHFILYNFNQILSSLLEKGLILNLGIFKTIIEQISGDQVLEFMFQDQDASLL